MSAGETKGGVEKDRFVKDVSQRQIAEGSGVLKGHDFRACPERSRMGAAEASSPDSALAAEGRLRSERTFPQGLKPEPLSSELIGTTEVVPFQSSPSTGQNKPMTLAAVRAELKNARGKKLW